jgi:glycosyltransferase involved in cell wall biosynthesis
MDPAPIAFAIPYYRNRAYLREAIESVRAQTHPDWELLVVDDAGPEPAEDLVAGYRDPRMRYLRHDTNLGMTENWNACLAMATARLTTLLHQDDRLLPRYAERVLAAAHRRPGAAAYFTDVRVIGPDGRSTTTPADLAKRLSRRPKEDYDLSGDAAMASIIANNYIFCPSMCLDREIVGADPFDAGWSQVQDLDFTTRQFLLGRRLHSVREVLFEYRRHEANQTEANTLDATRFVEEIELHRLLEIRARDRGWPRSERAARRRVMVRGHLAERMLADLAGRRPSAAREKWRLLCADLRGPVTSDH